MFNDSEPNNKPDALLCKTPQTVKKSYHRAAGCEHKSEIQAAERQSKSGPEFAKNTAS